MVRIERSPEGAPIEVLDGLRAGLAANRAQFFSMFPQDRSTASTARKPKFPKSRSTTGGVRAFSETDQTEDLKAITVPVLQDRRLQNSTLKIYPGYPHGMHTTYADIINADILAFIIR